MAWYTDIFSKYHLTLLKKTTISYFLVGNLLASKTKPATSIVERLRRIQHSDHNKMSDNTIGIQING